MKRIIRINYKNGGFEDIEISKAVQIDTDQTVFALEKTKDGKFRLTFGKKYIEDFSQVLDFEIVREEEKDEGDIVINVDHHKLIPEDHLRLMKSAKTEQDFNNLVQIINNQVLNRELDR